MHHHRLIFMPSPFKTACAVGQLPSKQGPAFYQPAPPLFWVLSASCRGWLHSASCQLSKLVVCRRAVVKVHSRQAGLRISTQRLSVNHISASDGIMVTGSLFLSRAGLGVCVGRGGGGVLVDKLGVVLCLMTWR